LKLFKITQNNSDYRCPNTHGNGQLLKD